MNLIDPLVSWDKELFLFLNGLHIDALDPFMVAFSSSYSFVIVVAAILLFMLKKEKMAGIIPCIALIVTAGINSGINNILKVIICRPRPIHESAFADVIHAVGKHETSFSFYSGHSTAAFCIAIFSILYFKNKLYTVFILLWALIVAYSRIYLGRHYPLDVLCGILMGALIGFLGFRLYQYVLDKKLSPKFKS